VHAGIGLAGANVPALAEAFRRLPLPFRCATVLSDARSLAWVLTWATTAAFLIHRHA
jgi:hypothetical protein